MRKGNVALFVVIVTAISLLLTASYSISTKTRTSSKAHAQSLPVEVLCGLTGQPCCTGNNVPLCEPTLSCSTQNVCLSNVNDPQYINQSCTVPDGRSGTCQWAVGEVTCTGNNELISGACPGSSDVRCCVAKAAAAPPATNPPPAAGGASCAGGVLCNNQPVTGTDGQTVCGLSNLSYTCNNGTWAATGQSCSCPNVAPPPATNPPPVSSGTQPPETACLKPLLRYVRPDNITHFYTANWSELGGGNAMWQYEGVMGYVESASSPGCYSASTQGFYRFIKTGTDLHFYQINNPTPPDATWASEGLVGYINAIDDSTKFTTILDRFYNAVTQDHFYTNNAAESSNLKANGQGYAFEFPAGWTFGSQALTASTNTPPAANPPASNPPVSSGPVTNTPPQTPGNPVTSTGSGAPGYQNYTRYSLDCTNGISVASTYVADPVDPTKPNIYFNVEQVTGATQSTPGTGTLLGQGVVPNGGTYNDAHVAWNSVGVPLQFYVYTFKENTDPKVEWTIHGVDATGNDVSAANGQPVPQPYSIQCPAGATPPATPGQQTPGGGTPPPIVNDGTSPVPEGTTKTDMEITIRIKLPDGPGTVSGNAPAVPTIPVEVEITNGYQQGDVANVSVQFTWKGAGVWEGKIPAQLIQGSHFTLSIWPDKHAKKTVCQAGPNSPHVMYPTTYECNGSDGTISLKAGANLLDFSSVLIGAGDLNVDKLRDGHIDAQDLYELSQYIIKQDRNNLNAGDINMDGVVNQRDYDLAVWSLENVTQ